MRSAAVNTCGNILASTDVYVGLTTGEIAGQLLISPKTADHHIQHVYAKIGVSTRAAAMLWAVQNAVVA